VTPWAGAGPGWHGRGGSPVGGQRQLPAPARLPVGPDAGLHRVHGRRRGDRRASTQQRHRLALLGHRPADSHWHAGGGLRRVRLRDPAGLAARRDRGDLVLVVVAADVRPDPGVHPAVVSHRPAAVGPLAPSRGGGRGRDRADRRGGCPGANPQAAERGLHRRQPHRAQGRPR
jgi:hypothetical protein